MSKKFNYVLVGFICLLIMSCQQKEDFQGALVNDSLEKEESFIENVKFASIAERLKNVTHRATAVTRNPNFVSPDKTNISIIILEFDDWGRTSKGCKGFGLCHVVWFPVTSVTEEYLKELGTGASILELDSTNQQYYIDILLAESAPIKNGELLPTLKVDQNLELSTSEAILKPMVVKKGEYSYNSQLGEHGGYRIAVGEE